MSPSTPVVRPWPALLARLPALCRRRLGGPQARLRRPAARADRGGRGQAPPRTACRDGSRAKQKEIDKEQEALRKEKEMLDKQAVRDERGDAGQKQTELQKKLYRARPEVGEGQGGDGRPRSARSCRPSSHEDGPDHRADRRARRPDHGLREDATPASSTRRRSWTSPTSWSASTTTSTPRRPPRRPRRAAKPAPPKAAPEEVSATCSCSRSAPAALGELAAHVGGELVGRCRARSITGVNGLAEARPGGALVLRQPALPQGAARATRAGAVLVGPGRAARATGVSLRAGRQPPPGVRQALRALPPARRARARRRARGAHVHPEAQVHPERHGDGRRHRRARAPAWARAPCSTPGVYVGEGAARRRGLHAVPERRGPRALHGGRPRHPPRLAA